jgi:cell division protein FtsB
MLISQNVLTNLDLCSMFLYNCTLKYNDIMWKEELAIKIKSSWKVFIPLSILLAFSFYLGAREFWKWFQINSEYSNIEKEIAVTKLKTEELKSEFQSLKNPELLEKEARGRLNLKKEGEYVLVVVGENNFPEENFLGTDSVSVFDNSDDIWFNLKSWRNYLFP